MEDNNTLDKLSQSLGNRATVKSVYGEPIESHGKTLIPVARVAYGFGGGHGNGRRNARSEHTGEGEGGGGGVVIAPRGVLEVTDNETKFLPVSFPRQLIGAAALGVLFGMILGGRRAKRKYRAKMESIKA